MYVTPELPMSMVRTGDIGVEDKKTTFSTTPGQGDEVENGRKRDPGRSEGRG